MTMCYLVSPLFRLFHRFRIDRADESVVLLWYTGKLGDLVCLTGVLRAFKETRLNNRLILIARAPFTDILANNPNVDEIISFRSDKELSAWSWMVGVWNRLSKYPIQEIHILVESLEAAIGGLWFHSSKRHLLVTTKRRSTALFLKRYYQLHTFPYTTRIKHFYLFEFVGVKASDEQYPNELFFPGTSSAVEKLWQDNRMDAYSIVIGVIPCSGKDFKRWPEEYWIELVKKFEGLGWEIVLFGAGKDERESIQRIYSKLSSRPMFVLDAPLALVPYHVKKCSLVVGVDTGLVYIADALGVPVVDIMGPVDEVHQRPEKKYTLVNNDAACPRLLQTPPRKRLSESEFQQIQHCFQSISVDLVFTACQKSVEE